MSAQMGQTIEKSKAYAAPKDLYLARFQQSGRIIFEGHEERTIALTGEILIAGETNQDGELLVQEVQRVSLVSEPFERLGGIASLAGPANRVRLDPGSSGRIESFDMRLYYSRLGRIEPTCKESDATYAQLEKLRGTLSWEPEKPERGEPRVRLSILLKDLVERHLGAIDAVELESIVVAFRRLEERPYEEQAAKSLVICTGSPPAGSTHDQRRLRIRVVNLSLIDSSTNLEPTVQALVDGACEVWWEKGGIRIDPQPNIPGPTSVQPGYTCTDSGTGTVKFCVSQTKESDLPNEIPGVTPTPNHVDVYLVDELTDRTGGGIAHLCASHDAYVIIEILHARHNRYLLAHELGHVLGLRHPGGSEGGQGCESSDLPEGSPCSVMVPHSPDSSRNTVNNFNGVDSAAPALGPSYGTIGDPPLKCGRAPDPSMSFFHIVRDFQYDDGTEPSTPKPPATDWWTYSDVWNSGKPPHPIYPHTYDSGDLTTPGDPIILPDFSPSHGEPSYAGPNYMYARVHTCQPLTAPVEVHLYLAVPSVTSEPLRGLEHGGASVIPLSFSGAERPKPGAPKIKYVQWDVPPGYPSNCCVFAVARSSDDTPPPEIAAVISNPAAHNFYDLFGHLRSDNDVAQRNLHIEGVTSTSGGSALPALHFENIFQEPADASLEIDATAAMGIKAVTVVVNDETLEKIEGNQLQLVRLSNDLQPGERLVIRLHVELPLQKSLGTVYPIQLRFFFKNQLVSGFRHVVRVTTLTQTAIQTLDVMHGASRDVAVAWDLDAARELARQAKAFMSMERGNPQPGDWQAAFGKLRDPVDALNQGLAAIAGHEPEYEVVMGHLDELAKVFRETESPYLLVERVRELAYRIQKLAGRVVRRR